MYARYVDRVRSGSWGDHVVVAAIANMFHVTINVVQATQCGCTLSITSPVNDTSNYEINLGLVMQYHFVGLDKQVMHIGVSLVISLAVTYAILIQCLCPMVYKSVLIINILCVT